MPEREVIAVAGAGDLGKYVCEELLASDAFDVVVLSRNPRNEWCETRNIPVHQTDHSHDSLLKILNESQATGMISFINIIGSEYIKLHTALLTACQQSRACKRLIPSEWIGDSEAYPLMPRYYASSREPFRQKLRSQDEVKWTLFNPGWLADYFLESRKTYMREIPGKNPADPNLSQAYIRGSGDEMQSWTCARDVGRALVELCKADHWVRGFDTTLSFPSLLLPKKPAITGSHTNIKELRGEQEQYTFVAGEWNSFNHALRVVEQFYGRKMTIIKNTSLSEIQSDVARRAQANEELTEDHHWAQVDEMIVLGCLTCPKAKTLQQRQKYFTNIAFMDLPTLLQHAANVDFV